MLNFEKRIGPDLGSASPVYPSQQIPEWFRDAKLGFFIHWGLYSVPAWATPNRDTEVPVEDSYAHHKYAEWYGNTVRIENSPTRKRHEKLYGVGTSYEDLADLWVADTFDADSFVNRLVDAGAHYIIPTTKHHEGFCLWDTETTNFNSVQRGPRRDLIREIAEATRARGTRFGVYFSGALDWHVSDYPPIESDTDLFRFRRNDTNFARYSAAQLEELVDRFSPDVLWNDIEWPDAGKGGDDFGVAALLSRYFSKVSDGVVNDRWGVPYHGYLTREYSYVENIIDHPWECTRGLGYSFGYNQAESETDSLSGAELVRLLVDVVSKNGNLLINVGPSAEGRIPELQLRSMEQMGSWLRTNGEAIYGTRPWIRANDTALGIPVSYTCSGDIVYLHVTDPAQGVLTLPPELATASTLEWLGTETAPLDLTTIRNSMVTIPDDLRGEPVAVAAVSLA